MIFADSLSNALSLMIPSGYLKDYGKCSDSGTVYDDRRVVIKAQDWVRYTVTRQFKELLSYCYSNKFCPADVGRAMRALALKERIARPTADIIMSGTAAGEKIFLDNQPINTPSVWRLTLKAWRRSESDRHGDTIVHQA